MFRGRKSQAKAPVVDMAGFASKRQGLALYLVVLHGNRPRRSVKSLLAIRALRHVSMEAFQEHLDRRHHTYDAED
jgi:hypothetical protein